MSNDKKNAATNPKQAKPKELTPAELLQIKGGNSTAQDGIVVEDIINL